MSALPPQQCPCTPDLKLLSQCDVNRFEVTSPPLAGGVPLSPCPHRCRVPTPQTRPPMHSLHPVHACPQPCSIPSGLLPCGGPGFLNKCSLHPEWHLSSPTRGLYFSLTPHFSACRITWQVFPGLACLQACSGHSSCKSMAARLAPSRRPVPLQLLDPKGHPSGSPLASLPTAKSWRNTTPDVPSSTQQGVPDNRSTAGKGMYQEPGWARIQGVARPSAPPTPWRWPTSPPTPR